ncbi:hypothetical protein CPY51_17765 [Rhizobium tubonense]|uniref:Uncharacterized protein n=2 Tax=Rhizobium tubonense TaxID=484088 RepID=A0A2W4CFR3_9HYPH|nr:hypothetical protein CPY51_17765 [Rhizobium tubonense]
MKLFLMDRLAAVPIAETAMFDHFAIVKIIELQNKADRERWKKDEASFYRELGDDPFDRFAAIWRYLRGITAAAKNKTDRRNIHRSVSNACNEVCDQAAR